MLVDVVQTLCSSHRAKRTDPRRHRSLLHHLAGERLVLDDEVPFDQVWRFVTDIPVEGESWITPFLAVETPRVPMGEVKTELLTVIHLHQSVAVWTLIEVSDP